MITYDELWKTLANKNLKKQDLVDKYNFSKGLIDNLNHNRNITTRTIDDICQKLNITPDQILTYKRK